MWLARVPIHHIWEELKFKRFTSRISNVVSLILGTLRRLLRLRLGEMRKIKMKQGKLPLTKRLILVNKEFKIIMRFWGKAHPVSWRKTIARTWPSSVSIEAYEWILRRSFSLLFNSSARLTYFNDALLLGISCARLFILGRRTTGYYRIHKPKIAVLPGNMSYIPAWCDMQGADGGWILLQQRNDTTVNFSRNWVSFENGFGKPGVGFWVGNKYMHAITLNRRHMLRIELPDIYWGDQSLFGEYDNFQVSSPSTNYILQVGNFRGNMANILSAVNNSAFSTWDRDNDDLDGSCVMEMKGAWWYGDDCLVAIPNRMVRFVRISMKAKELLGGNF